MNPEKVRNLGWRVTMAGVGINLALGVVYAWSVISSAIPESWGWSQQEKTLPYSLALLFFALFMVPAGRLQDRFGPRWVALAGGVAVGLGMIVASCTSSVLGFSIGFGVLSGAGIGLAYAAATPAAVKWFPSAKTGTIAGIVVAGFGLASVYIAPLCQYLIRTFSEPVVGTTLAGNGLVDTGPGVQMTMLILGGAFLVSVGILSQFLRVPPKGWKPAQPAKKTAAATAPAADRTWREMMATPQFWCMWTMYAFAAGAGLMIIGNLKNIADVQTATKAGFIFVALLAVGNAAGRVVAGMLTDKLGARTTMAIVFVLQAGVLFSLQHVSDFTAFLVLSMVIGANYGANLSIFPTVTKGWFGMKNFGLNYGLVFTAWGFGGLVLAQIAGKVYDATGSYGTAYLIAAGALVVAAGLALAVRAPAVRAAPKQPEVRRPEPVGAGA
jgi:OFA family oxalate/formate antiporter-like MFS transporter